MVDLIVESGDSMLLGETSWARCLDCAFSLGALTVTFRLDRGRWNEMIAQLTNASD